MKRFAARVDRRRAYPWLNGCEIFGLSIIGLDDGTLELASDHVKRFIRWFPFHPGVEHLVANLPSR